MILKSIDSRAQTDRSFQAALQVAMGRLGWILPETEAAVRATSQTDGAIELPDELGLHELNVLSGSVPSRQSKPECARSDVA